MFLGLMTGIAASTPILSQETNAIPKNAATAASRCPVSANSEPLGAGLSRITVKSLCRPSYRVRFQYGGFEFVRALDSNGSHEFILDCFLGDTSGLTAVFDDGASIDIPVRTSGLDRVTKVALIWRGPVNLDLHAREYAALSPDAGDVWAKAPSSRASAEERIRQEGRGRGFISTSSEGGSEGDQLEVYTFIHSGTQAAGVIAMALDYESRERRPQDPDTCGMGLYADLAYQAVIWHSSGKISRTSGSFASVNCNATLDRYARYNSKAIPDLRITR
jgi:hypothetical protein